MNIQPVFNQPCHVHIFIENRYNFASHGLYRIVMVLHHGNGNGYIIFVGKAAFEGNDLYLGLVQQASLVYLVSCTLPLAVRVKLVACLELRHSLPHSIQWELCNT